MCVPPQIGLILRKMSAYRIHELKGRPRGRYAHGQSASYSCQIVFYLSLYVLSKAPGGPLTGGGADGDTNGQHWARWGYKKPLVGFTGRPLTLRGISAL